MKLRNYQKNAIIELYDFLKTNKGLNPCLVLPTGAGKSVVIAKIINDFFKKSSGNLLMITHVSLLIEQNYKETLSLVDADNIGIYSQGIGRKELNKKVTFAGIQSLHKVETPDYKVILIDECHLVPVKNKGTYRKFLDKHKDALIIGLTATPYRMDNGYINVGDDALFDDLIIPEGTTIPELIEGGYLSKLKSKISDAGNFNFKTVKKRGADYDEKELSVILNQTDAIKAVVTDIILRTKECKHVLIFCADIAHTENVSQEFCNQNEKAFYVHGSMNKSDAKMAIDSFKSGRIKYLCNRDLLTTGFNFKDIDCVVMLRKTKSTGLYQQIIGRGLRLKGHTDYCLILDYVGNIEEHGTIINPKIKDKSTPLGVICPQCLEANVFDALVCIDCGYDLTKKKIEEEAEREATKEATKEAVKEYELSDIDILYDESKLNEVLISGWIWKTYKSKADGTTGVMGEFFSVDKSIKGILMFLPIENKNAVYAILGNLKKLKVVKEYEFYLQAGSVNGFVNFMNIKAPIPKSVEIKKENNFYKFLKINY